MTDMLYTNATIATMRPCSAPYGIISDGAIGICDGRIDYVGPALDAPDHYVSTTNLSGALIMPGFVDCHTHLIYGGDRAAEFEMRLAGESYEAIAKAGGGILSTVTATRNASLEELIASGKSRLQAMQRMGTTTVEIKSGYGLTLDSELKMLRAAIGLEAETGVTVLTTLLAAHAVPPEFKDRADAYIDHICADVIPAAIEADCVDAVDAFCEHIAFSPDQVRRLFAFAVAAGLDVKLHAEQLSNQHGAALAASFNALSADHLEYLDTDGITAMAKTGTVAVMLPGAYYTLKETKKPPIEALREAGVPMALATDCNPGSSPITNIQLVASMGCQLFDMTPEEAVRGITINGAKALGIESDFGSLETGKAADMLIFDTITHPRDILYTIGGVQPKSVLKFGKTVHSNSTP